MTDNANEILSNRKTCIWLMLALLVAIWVGGVGNAWGHSTEGLVRAQLDKERPTYDDFAFFIEPYVNQEKYKGVHQPYMGRFYAMDDVMELRLEGREAEATFEVLDMRGNDRFLDTMRFIRGDDGVWRYMEAEGGPREVYTYIPEWQHILKTKVQPASMIGLPVMLALLIWLRLRRKKGPKQVAESIEPT
ncbi:hypothetical protein [Desulfonatronum lacustre]|uniref:hypothetical protein n=1 Tax=Desulfonatronum lacustre TaxID=66849 RepID=UPI00048D0376|nr:hypothetical protein [Desulfonatronum lacustre]SMP76734.1 hypothetical protein SAMN06295888_1256 [Desulfonatronum zhilinae]